MDNMLSMISRASFLLAVACVALGVFERVAYEMGYTVLRGTIAGGRLFEIAAILVVFVIAVLLRQIRDQLRQGS
ncbi:MAG: hypothetical protein ACHQ6T_05570 [Myxococcota bacterium]